MAEKRKTMTGKVVSNKMTKTVVVAVEKVKHHTLYDKTIRHTVKYKAHCDQACNIGDVVDIAESRPLSHEKHWRVVKVTPRKTAAPRKNQRLSLGFR